MKKILLIYGLLLFFFSFKSNATIIYVDSSHVGGTQNGISWATAFSNFQAGVNAANEGDSVWVAKGTYQPTINTSFVMKDGVKIYGGFLNTYTTFSLRNSTANASILKGNSNSVIKNDGNNLSSTAVIDGFIITNGSASNGGGIYNFNSSPQITNCNIRNNVCNTNGGGIYTNDTLFISNCNISANISETGCGIYSSSRLIVENCKIESNISNSNFSSLGGGLYCSGVSQIHNTIIRKNKAFAGGGVHVSGVSIVKNCIIDSNNTSYGDGGGIVSSNGITIDSCIIRENSAYNSITAFGGGLLCTGSGSATISNSTISYNKLSGHFGAYGGGISAAVPITIINCMIAFNRVDCNSTSYGGGLYCLELATLNGCSISNNTSYTASSSESEYAYGGGICGFGSLILNNCIFQNNVALKYISHYGTFGGGIYSKASVLTNTNCSFLNNTADYGGAICHKPEFSGSNFSISNCSLNNNIGRRYGGGICNYGNTWTTINPTYSTINIKNCIFSKNIAPNGAGIANLDVFPTIVNTLFAKNIADTFGGAIYNTGTNDTGSIPRIINCTIVQNKALNGGGAIYNEHNSVSEITNTILWSNNTGIANDTTSSSIRRYSLVQGMPGSLSEHNIDGNNNPNFVDTSSENYNLDNLSYCINSGNNDSLPLNNINDLANNTRIFDGIIEMGAYEYTLVLPPAITLGNDTVLCGDTFEIHAPYSAYTNYLWNTGDTTQAINVFVGGTYYVTATSIIGSSSDTIHVILHPLPTIDIGNDTSLCMGNSLIIDAGSNGTTYLWNNNDTTQTITINGSGNYSVSIMDSNGCVNSDTINVIVNPLPEVDLGNDTSFCGVGILDAQNLGSTYIWNNGANTPTIVADVTGSYSVTVINSNLCYASDTIQVSILPSPIVNLGNDTIILSGASIILDANNSNATYLWSTGATTQTITVNTSGTYSVVVTNTGGCSSSDTVVVSMSPDGIEDASDISQTIKVYPNPAKDIININISNLELLHSKVILVDAFGRTIRSIAIENKLQGLFMAGIAPGIYVLKFENGATAKIIKQ